MAATSKVNVQISVSGRGVSRLSHKALVSLVEQTVNGDKPPNGIRVRIQLWRKGQELEWNTDDARSAGLRALIRRVLHGRRFPFQVRSH